MNDVFNFFVHVKELDTNKICQHIVREMLKMTADLVCSAVSAVAS